MKPQGKHIAFRDDIIKVLRRHGDALSAVEILALTSHIVGQIIAMQDQRTMTKELALKIVSDNIEQGNKELVQGLNITTGQMQ